MLTKKGYTAVLERIRETGGYTEAMEKDLKALESDLDEREGILAKYGEEYDGEKYEWDFKEKPVIPSGDSLDSK